MRFAVLAILSVAVLVTTLPAWGQDYRQVKITWTTDCPLGQWWKLDRRPGDGGAYSILAQLDPSISSFTDVVLDNATYIYRISSCSTAGCIPLIGEILAVLMPKTTIVSCPPCPLCDSCPSVCPSGYSCRKTSGNSR